MTTSPTDFRARRAAEGQRIYQALFPRAIPAVLLERYLVAAERLDAPLAAEQLDAYYRSIESCADLEALEFAARLTGRLPLLRRKFQAMIYLAETLPDHQGFYVKGRSSRWGGFAELASSALATPALGIRGLLALRGLPHG